MRPVVPLLLAALLAAGTLPARAGEGRTNGPPNKLERVLTGAQRAAVLGGVRACLHEPAGVPAGETVTLLIVVDGDNTVLDATVVPEDVDRVDTPGLRGFAIAAIRAVTDPSCSHLAMPGDRLARPWLFRLRFVG